MRTVDSSQCAECAGRHSQLLVRPEPARIRCQPDSNAKDHHNSGSQQQRQQTLRASQNTPKLRAGIRHWWKRYQSRSIFAMGFTPQKLTSKRTPAANAATAETVRILRCKSCRMNSAVESMCQFAGAGGKRDSRMWSGMSPEPWFRESIELQTKSTLTHVG